jgi:hypothetical protein
VFSLSLTEEVIDTVASSSEALNNDVILHSQEAQQDIQQAMGMTGEKRLLFRAYGIIRVVPSAAFGQRFRNPSVSLLVAQRQADFRKQLELGLDFRFQSTRGIPTMAQASEKRVQSQRSRSQAKKKTAATTAPQCWSSNPLIL